MEICCHLAFQSLPLHQRQTAMSLLTTQCLESSFHGNFCDNSDTIILQSVELLPYHMPGTSTYTKFQGNSKCSVYITFVNKPETKTCIPFFLSCGVLFLFLFFSFIRIMFNGNGSCFTRLMNPNYAGLNSFTFDHVLRLYNRERTITSLNY